MGKRLNEARVRVETKRLRSALNSRYTRAEATQMAGSAGNELVSVDGQLYPSTAGYVAGGVVSVQNVGRAAAALYAPTQAGVSVAIRAGGGGGGAAGTGGGVTVVPGSYVPLTRQVIAGQGLTGGGALSSDVTLNVGAGQLISVAGDTVGLVSGAAYQFIGTGADTLPEWRNVSELAGAGLVSPTGVLAVGAGAGLTVTADAVALTTPGSLSWSSTNNAAGNHAHAVVSLADASGAQTGLMRAEGGELRLDTLNADVQVWTPKLTYNGDLLLGPTGDVRLTPGSGAWVELTDGKSLRTASFASGFVGNGFRLDQGVSTAARTTFEVDDLWVRGQMHVYELLIHQIRATNGSIFVSNTGKLTAVTLATGTQGAIGSTYRLYVDPEIGNTFAVDDLIRAQRWTGSGVYYSDLEISYVDPGNAYCIGRLKGGVAPQVGFEYVRLGNETNVNRQGGVYLTADDSGAPFIDVFDGVNAFTDWNTAGVVKARLGKLTGLFSVANEYGFYAGEGTTDTDSYVRVSNLTAEMRNVPLRMYNGAINTGFWDKNGQLDIGFDGVGVINNRDFTVHASGYVRIGRANTGNANLLYHQVNGYLALRSGPIDKIRFDNDGSAYIAGALTLGTSGGIWQGSGTFAAPTTGLKLWNDGGVGRIAGYDGGDLQAGFDTGGKFIFARSLGTLGYNGARLAAKNSNVAYDYDSWRSYGFTGPSGADIGGLYAQYFGTPAVRILDLKTEGGNNTQQSVKLTANVASGGSGYGQIDLNAAMGAETARLLVNSNPSLGAEVQVYGFLDAGSPITGAVDYHRFSGRINVTNAGDGANAGLAVTRTASDGLISLLGVNYGGDTAQCAFYGYTDDYGTTYLRDSILLQATSSVDTFFVAAEAAAGAIQFHTNGAPSAANLRAVVNQYGFGVGVAPDASYMFRVDGISRFEDAINVITHVNVDRTLTLKGISAANEASYAPAAAGFLRLYYYDGGASSTRHLRCVFPDGARKTIATNV